MNFADYCYGPLEDVLNALQGDYPPNDPAILRAVLARCVEEVISLRKALAAQQPASHGAGVSDDEH